MIEERKKSLPTIELTRLEFSLIPKVKSQAEVQAYADSGLERVTCKGDCGNWFVCYPKDKALFVVKFIAPRKSPLGTLQPSEMVAKVVEAKETLRERK